MFKRLNENSYKENSVTSYIGLLEHGNTFKIKEKIYSNKKFLNDL